MVVVCGATEGMDVWGVDDGREIKEGGGKSAWSIRVPRVGDK